MNVKDMLRQASDAAKQLITLSDQTIIGILKETAQVLRTHTEEVLQMYQLAFGIRLEKQIRRESPRSGTYGPRKPEIRPAEIDRGKATRYRRRYGECIDITFSIK